MARPRRHPRSDRVREAAAARYEARSPAGGVRGILLDSDVIIRALRGRAPTSAEILALERDGVVTYCCVVSWAEIFAGLRPNEETATEAFFDVRTEVVVDARISRRAGGYLAHFAKSHGLDVPDALIAAAVSVTGRRFWTLNRRHYPMDDVHFYEPPRAR